MSNTCLRADCARCAALCCVALAFDASDDFAIDKPAGYACPHLSARGKCRIHHARESQGFRGCIHYTCHGAGQRVTQELFGGHSWQDDPSLLYPMMDAFRQMRLVHELLVLLEEAGGLPLEAEQRRIHSRLVSKLMPAAGWTLTSLALFERGQTAAQIRAFLRSLRPLFGRKTRKEAEIGAS